MEQTFAIVEAIKTGKVDVPQSVKDQMLAPPPAPPADWKPATINAYVCTLKPFLRWAHQMSSGGVRYIDEDLTGILSTVRIPAPDELPDDRIPVSNRYLANRLNVWVLFPSFLPTKHHHHQLKQRL